MATTTQAPSAAVAASNVSEIFLQRVFHYDPSIAFAVAAIAAFAAVTIAALVLTCKYGGKFMYIVFGTGCAEVLGYTMRVTAAQDASLGPYIGSSFFLLVSPIALALVNYLVIARLLHQVDKPVWMFRTLQPQQIARFFVTSDFVCFFLQASGGGLLAVTNPSVNNIGIAIVLVGLAVQLIFFTGFTWITYRVATQDEYLLKFVPAVRPVFVGLAITIFFLYVRNVYRVVEFASGNSSYVDDNEWTFGVFETLPIFLAFVTYLTFHFGRLLDCNEAQPRWIEQLEAARQQEGEMKSKSNSDDPEKKPFSSA